MPKCFLLDTDHCIAYLQPSQPAPAIVAQRMARMSAADLRIAEATAMELCEGPWHSQQAAAFHLARRSLHTFLSWIPILSPSFKGIEEFGRLRAILRQQACLIPDFDLTIAVTALAHGLTLVTHNTRHFSRIPDLVLDDWIP